MLLVVAAAARRPRAAAAVARHNPRVAYPPVPAAADRVHVRHVQIGFRNTNSVPYEDHAKLHLLGKTDAHQFRPSSQLVPPTKVLQFKCSGSGILIAWSRNLVAVREPGKLSLLDLVSNRLFLLSYPRTGLPSSVPTSLKSTSLAAMAHKISQQFWYRSKLSTIICHMPEQRAGLAGKAMPSLRGLEFWSGFHADDHADLLTLKTDQSLELEGMSAEETSDAIMGGTITPVPGDRLDPAADYAWMFTQPPPGFPISDHVGPEGTTIGVSFSTGSVHGQEIPTLSSSEDVDRLIGALRLLHVHPLCLDQVVARGKIPTRTSVMGWGPEAQLEFGGASEGRELLDFVFPQKELQDTPIVLCDTMDTCQTDRSAVIELFPRILQTKTKTEHDVLREYAALPTGAEGLSARVEAVLTAPMLASSGGWTPGEQLMLEFQNTMSEGLTAGIPLAQVAARVLHGQEDAELPIEKVIEVCDEHLATTETPQWHIIRALACATVDGPPTFASGYGPGTDIEHRRAIEGFTRALQLNPGRTNVVVDLGKRLALGFAEEVGFACFDVARVVSPTTPQLSDEIDPMCASLLARFHPVPNAPAMVNKVVV
jgi:hypothetical protein